MGLVKVLTAIVAILPKLLQAVAFVVAVVEVASEADGAKGAEKKAKAISLLKELFPPSLLPDFLAERYDAVAGLLIDAVVALFNRMGFFQKSGQAS
ncbi:hypothetical protein MN1_170 [Thermus phage MN1]|nr:hypothetical protein MN1_170 [Thermus phage MN1]